MAKNKGIRLLVTIECAKCRLSTNQSGISRYITQKNRRNTPDRIELKKYCPYCDQRTVHKEIK